MDIGGKIVGIEIVVLRHIPSTTYTYTLSYTYYNIRHIPYSICIYLLSLYREGQSFNNCLLFGNTGDW